MRLLRVMTIFVISCLACGAALAENVTFSYQGRVHVQGQPFNGTGLFKFAIMDTSATVVLWSNDGTLTGEPGSSISLSVTDGVFSATIGDTTAGMAPINPSIFSSRTPLKMRVWFNDGSHGFEQLHPDQNLVDLALNTIFTGNEDYTIYVDGSIGNDSYNGLTLTRPKKTIQAAVDVVPSQLRCNVTVKIAAGDYKEQVSVYGINSAATAAEFNHTFDGSHLRIVGDDTWTSLSAGSPSVRIMGSDTDTTASVRDRRYCMLIHNCSGVYLKGLWFDLAGHTGVKMENGNYIVENCKATRAVFSGMSGLQGTFTNYVGCVSEYSPNGFYVWEGVMYIVACKAQYNTAFGVMTRSNLM